MKITSCFLIIFCLFSNKIYSYSIVASILPLQSLTAMVTEDITSVQLLLNPQISPHDVELTYQTSSLIHNSKIIVIVSKDFEKTIYNAVSNKNNLIIMLNAPHLRIKNYTNSLVLQDSSSKINNNTPDPHIWLDPNNAIAFLEYLASELALRDPKHATQYHTNATKYIKLLMALNSNLQTSPTIHSSNFLIYHNGYDYLISNFNLNTHYKGYLTKHSHEGNSISIKFLLNLQTFIQANNISCILMEQNLPNPVIQKFIKDNNLNTGTLNILGTNNYQGKVQNIYFDLLNNNVHTIQDCIKK